MKGGEVILGECRANLGYAEGDVELIKREHFEAIDTISTFEMIKGLVESWKESTLRGKDGVGGR
jgi:hypothetical protein